MNELVQQRLREWRSGAIRQLHEMERLARDLRDRLEEGDTDLGDLVHESSDLGSYVMTFTTYVDRTVALVDVGFKE